MKKYFLLINVIVGFGCSSTVQKQDVIPPETMVELLTEIHILEAQVDKLRLTKDSTYMVYNTLEQEIFEKYAVNKALYEESFKFYLARPERLDKIYSVVVDSLNVIQKRGYQEDTELQTAKTAQRLADSVRRNPKIEGQPVKPKTKAQ